MGKKQLFINLASNIISFVIQLGISFLLTPIIVEKTGNAAYGFIGLANNFVSYANIFTAIINSMSSRFITFELAKDNILEANKYYSSVFFVNMIMSILIAIASTVIIINLNDIISIPLHLEEDVKVTFILSFLNLIISLISTVFGIATFAKNRLEISAIRNITFNILKVAILITLFSLLPAKIYYISLAAFIITICGIISNVKITKKIAPELKCDLKNYDKDCVKELAKSGIWNSLNSLSRVLLTGLDLLIANLFVGPEQMGLLSIAKTVPNNIESLLGTISGTFISQFIMLYSKREIKKLIETVKFSMKILGLMMIVPIAAFIVFGEDFFSLWLPFKSIEEIKQIQILSILSLAPYIISANNFTLAPLDTVTNKLKRPVIVTIVMSIVSIITTFIVLKFTSLGIYAIAGVSSIFWCAKVLIFNTINASKNLRIKWYTFFKPFFENIICFIVITLLFILIKDYLVLASWKEFILSLAIVGGLGYIIVFNILLSKEDKEKIYVMINNKIKCAIKKA